MIMDSLLFVLRGMEELRKLGVFAFALMKKRRYWMKYFPGNTMEHQMYAKEVVSSNTLQTSMENTTYNIFFLNNPYCNVNNMSTFERDPQFFVTSFTYRWTFLKVDFCEMPDTIKNEGKKS